MHSLTRRFGCIALVASALALTGCYHDPNPKEWGAAAKANFVSGCTKEVTAGGGTTTSVLIEQKDTCECIYDAMVKTYGLSWEDMSEYEKKQADADAGDEPPTPPKELTKAIDDCSVKGPAVPAS